MTTTGQVTSSYHDRDRRGDRQSQSSSPSRGWAITRPGHASPPDDPCNSLDPAT
jgi:hypothetical protein